MEKNYRFKELRINAGKTQTDIANFLEIKQASYQNYESGITEPSIEKLTKLADFYNVSIDYLVNRPFNNEFGYLTEEERLLVANFRQLNAYNQAKIIGEVTGILIAQN